MRQLFGAPPRIKLYWSEKEGTMFGPDRFRWIAVLPSRVGTRTSRRSV